MFDVVFVECDGFEKGCGGSCEAIGETLLFVCAIVSMLVMETWWRCGGVCMTSVVVNCIFSNIIATLVPLPNESHVLPLPVGLPLLVVHRVGRCSPHHCAGHLLHALLFGGASRLHLVVEWFHSSCWESCGLPCVVRLGGWAL